MLDGKKPLVYEAADPILVLFLILVEMGFGFLSSLLLLALVVRCFGSQQPNTDGFFLSDFLKRMGYELPSSVEYTSSSVCSWKGVSCDSKGEKVVSFVASDLGLSGPMPDNTIGKLSKLQVLDLSVNNITGLSTDLWGLGSSLKRLNLSMNRIQGSLPNNIGNFGNMESLDLSRNGFSGEIPTNIGSMLTLRLLNLSKNSFEGTIPDGIADCRNLVALDLSGNRIRGKMPDFSGLESLSHLNLSGNFLNDSILGVLKEGLKVVDLNNNQFQGQVSAGTLDLNFSVSSLVYLDISGNHLNAEFFSNLSLALSLKHLNLAGNRLSHKKFPNLQLPSRLDYLNLSETSLNGNISPEISKLVGLKTLDLSKNHLVGEIPDLSIVVNLQILDLSSNNLTGEIPTPILHKLPNMKWFNLSYNNLSFCKETSSLQTFNSSFIGLQNSCPIAANPDVIASMGINHKRLKLAMAIGLSVACLLIGVACFAFARGSSTSSWAMKQLSYKEDDNVTGPYSFNTDSTMWVADVRSATSVPVVMFEKPLLSFTFADLLAATSNFDRGTLLAEGRHGPVYRGFLPGVMHVAIKVLPRRPASNDQDDARELEILGRMRHPNIVPLIGYCLAGDQRIAIYEYMENGNLQNLLHDLPLGIQATEDWSSDTWEDETNGVQKITTSGVSTWRFRHRIALGVARALAFLHHGCFPQAVHRDLKSSKVYLDASLEPRLSYFGLEKVAGSELEDVAYRGSPGYAPPELSDPELDVFSAATPKGDVFGFGVILFELITGKKALGDHYPEGRSSSLVDWARAMVRSNQCLVAIDSKIRETGSEKEMEEALRIAYLCTADLPSKRPSMQQVVGLLKDIEPVGRE